MIEFLIGITALAAGLMIADPIYPHDMKWGLLSLGVSALLILGANVTP